MAHQGFSAKLQHSLQRVTPGESCADFARQQSFPDSLGQSPFRPLTRGNLPLQIGGVAQHVGVQTAVLVNAADLSSEDACQALIFFADLVAPPPVDQADVPIDPCWRGDGGAQPCINWRSRGREAECCRIAARILHADAAALSQQGSQYPRSRIRRADLSGGFSINAAGIETL